jgi:hypothetical protein
MDGLSSGIEVVAAVLFLVLYGIPLVWAGYLMLARFDRGFEGALYGFLFGPLGLVMAWVMRDNEFRDQAERRAGVHEDREERSDPRSVVPRQRDTDQPRRFR